ncbi:hypothetical protein MKZ38_002060 [Zalerion maritima]|uniref:Apple domain-containing protein n=1 Tax=Zalerion maritima TaxID=339359 RepID=A0AAD5RXB9_9PEZI|nr:hypothetical protein MKZ38_002060 [Zalerion maritima]
MASAHHDAPEVVPQYLPEVVQPQQTPTQQYQSLQGQPPGIPQPSKSPDQFAYQGAAGAYTPGAKHSTIYGSTPANDVTSTYTGAPPTTLPPHEKPRKTICGCGMLVFILSVVIGVLAAAVIGLAAGTGIEANRVATAETLNDELSSSLAALGAVPTTTGSAESTSTETASTVNYDNVTNGCSTQSEKVSGTIYTPPFYNKPSYKMYCNSDTPLGPLMALFTANFNTCMDACASYTDYLNVTCAAVSFVPEWNNITTAVDGSAPGSCYLKPGPQNTTALTDSSWIEVHAAILDD